MNEINSGKISNFRVEFTPQIVYQTLDGLLQQFKKLHVVKFEIEIYGYTIKQVKVPVWFKNDVGTWSVKKLQVSNLENLFAVMREHGNQEAFFNVFYEKPYKRKIEAKTE